MAIHAWSILCERADLESDRPISIHNIIEELHVNLEPGDELPVTLKVDFYLVTLWMRTDRAVPEKLEHRVVLHGLLGAFEPSPVAEVSMEGPHVRGRVWGKIVDLQIDGAGFYDFVIEYRASPNDSWVEAARVPLQVDVRGP
jgi:hypothetical protein